MGCVVYTCHKVAPLPHGTEAPGTVNLKSFASQIKWLKRMGVTFVSMRSLLAWLRGEHGLPKRSAVLTFDDAYASIYEHAYPLLIEEAIPFTVFVIAGLMGQESSMYAHRGGTSERHLTIAELSALVAGGLVEVGAHSYHHLNLNSIEPDQMEMETSGAKQFLEDALNIEIPYFAYPYGVTTESVIENVKKSGYKLAFTTSKRKISSRNVELLSLPRVNWGRKSTVFKLARHHFFPAV